MEAETLTTMVLQSSTLSLMERLGVQEDKIPSQPPATRLSTGMAGGPQAQL